MASIWNLLEPFCGFVSQTQNDKKLQCFADQVGTGFWLDISVHTNMTFYSSDFFHCQMVSNTKPVYIQVPMHVHSNSNFKFGELYHSCFF